MAALRDKPLSKEQCLLMVHAKFDEWRASLDRIATSVQDWQNSHGHEFMHDHQPDLLPKSKYRTTSTIQSDKDSGGEIRGRSNQPQDGTPGKRSKDSSEQPGSAGRSLIVFDARSQKMIEELTSSLQVARNQLFRSLNTALSPEARRLERAQKLLFAKPKDRDPKEISESGQIRGQIMRLESAMGEGQKRCEEAANQLLRRGSCSKELTEAGHLLQRCAEEATSAIEQNNIKEDPAAGSAKFLQKSTSPGNMGHPSHLSLEVDDDDDNDDDDDPQRMGEGDNERPFDTRLQALRQRSDQFASRTRGPR
ncbi:hypothetical protein K461DRAFT_268476 [Myriangium duriaei CBS 260.36]|uniref:Uncharacterized protein n=1 Tax=Myriangium duriaei CBS 260.36 TaxID=1168546 RepID=A0A9P4MGU5_9PEZI|nr:hypothetical protein K461DRAFT_268476 [Myriangium duriaei CBS 260.36]